MTIDESYRELGLAPGSSDAEVKEAWRRLAARWHPDRNASPHALRKIQRINRALAEIRRAKTGGATEPASEWPARGDVVEHTVRIRLEEACSGCVRELQGEVREECAECAGTGLHARPSPCSDCEGSGRVRPHLWFSWLAGATECGTCHGEGSRRLRCAACEGSGHARPRKYRCRVEVPAGAHTGTVLAVRARVQGRSRHHELDLRVRVELEPHPLFTLQDGGKVHCEMPVDGFAWMAERWIDVPTPRGLQQMRLRRGYLTYRIKGGGLPAGEAQEPADCMVTVVPLFPEELGTQQQALVDKLVATNTGAAATPAGQRMARWDAEVRAWQGQQ
jgi:DnaJ-class molecular chaperone